MKIARIDAFPLQYPEPHDSEKLRYVTLVRIEADEGTLVGENVFRNGPKAALAVKVIIDSRLCSAVERPQPTRYSFAIGS